MKKNTFLFFFFLLFSFSPNVLSQTVNLFFSDFEDAASAWTTGSLLGENKWEIDECAGNGLVSFGETTPTNCLFYKNKANINRGLPFPKTTP